MPKFRNREQYEKWKAERMQGWSRYDFTLKGKARLKMEQFASNSGEYEEEFWNSIESFEVF